MKEHKQTNNNNTHIKDNIIKYVGTISAGTLGIMHAASHLIPSIANIGYSIDSHINHNTKIIDDMYVNTDPKLLEQILHHPITNLASLLFVGLGFYYIYKDHKHHKEEHTLKQEKIYMKNKIDNLEKELSKYKETIKNDIIYY